MPYSLNVINPAPLENLQTATKINVGSFKFKLICIRNIQLINQLLPRSDLDWAESLEGSLSLRVETIFIYNSIVGS